MNQRTLAGIVAVPLVVALWAAAFFLPAPFVTYYPGQTADLIGAEDGASITVEDHEVYPPTAGELRMTTASISRPETKVTLAEALLAWRDSDATVRPYDTVYSDDEDDQTSAQQSALQMTSSVDLSVAVALEALDIDVASTVQVGAIGDGSPAADVLQPGDIILAVDGEALTEPAQLGEIVRRAGVGATFDLTVKRDGSEQQVQITSTAVEDEVTGETVARIGITPIQGFDFPFPVTLTPPPGIGGSSAGTMFALAVYDYLTPGNLTGGLDIAGTGTISLDGQVGQIGGITQKIPGARDAGADVFLVPAPNCGEALQAARGSMRIVAIDTFDRALSTVEALAQDPDADVMTCEDVVG